jgi:uncharacterized protein YkwD
LNLERLETREVLTAGGPTEQAQYALEVLNLVRTDPAAGAAWVQEHADAEVAANVAYYNVDLNAVKNTIASAPRRQPLAWNARLASAAQSHSDDMARNKFQSHNGSDGSNVEHRLDRAGYTDRIQASENAFAYSSSVDNALEAFLIDWGVADGGHRRNIQQPDIDDDNSSAEVGMGMTRSSGIGGSHLVVTQNFGRQRGAKAQIVGVVFEDRDRNGRYSMGEGRGDVTVDVQNVSTGATNSLATWDAGGYQASVDPGTYRVSARSGDRFLGSQQVTVGKANVKVDFNTNNAPSVAPARTEPVAIAALSAPRAEVARKAAAPDVTTAPVVTPAPQVVVNAINPTAPADAWSTININWSTRWRAK